MATRVSTQLLDSISDESVFPEIVDTFEQKASYFNEIMKGDGEDVSSKGCRIPAYLVPSASNGWSDEGGDLPIPVADEDAAMRVRFTRYRRAMEITWDALREMEKGKTLLKGVMGRVSRHSNSAFKELNRQMYGSGDGTVAIPLSLASLTITFANTTANGYTHGSRKILKNGRYQFISSTGAILAGGMSGNVCTCTAISRSGATATFDQVPNDLATAIGVGTCRLVYQNSYNRGLRGNLYHFSNGNEVYQTLSRQDYNDLRATVVDADTSDITVALFFELEQEMKFRTEDEDAGEKMWLCNPSQVYQYSLLGHSAKRFDGKEKTYDGAYKKYVIGGDVFTEDVDADYDKMYCVYKKAFRKFENRAFGPLREGSGFWRDVPAFTVGSEDTGTHKERVRGYLGWDGELGCIHPNWLGVIKNLGFKRLGVNY